MKDLIQDISKVARKAGKLISENRHNDVFQKSGRANFVTDMDVASQKMIVSELKSIIPDANFFAEESEDNELKQGFNWIIDPIDGTTNYMLGYNHSAISIGLVKDNEGILGVVYDPYRDEMFTAVKDEGAFLNGNSIKAESRPIESAVFAFGTAMYNRELTDLTFNTARAVFDICGDLRRSGSAALDMCYVACGRTDAFFEMILQPWDYAAASVIAREAGAKAGGFLGSKLDYSSATGVLTGTYPIYERIHKIIEEQAALLKKQ